MSNLEMLQKLSLGTEDTETVTIELENGLTADYTLRPLTDGELTKLQAYEKKPYSMKIKVNANGEREHVERKANTDMDVSMGDFTEYQAKTMYMAIAWSLSVNGENVTSKDVEGLYKGVPELLFTEVIRISKLTENDLTAIKQFRK